MWCLYDENAVQTLAKILPCCYKKYAISQEQIAKVHGSLYAIKEEYSKNHVEPKQRVERRELFPSLDNLLKAKSYKDFFKKRDSGRRSWCRPVRK
jgi:hypothetical protein